MLIMCKTPFETSFALSQGNFQYFPTKFYPPFLSPNKTFQPCLSSEFNFLCSFSSLLMSNLDVGGEKLVVFFIGYSSACFSFFFSQRFDFDFDAFYLLSLYTSYAGVHDRKTNLVVPEMLTRLNISVLC